MDLRARPAAPVPAPEVPAVAPAPQRPMAARPPAPADQPPRAWSTPASAPAGAVRTGDSCATAGQTATTTRGGVAVCTASRGNGRTKWRAA
jgi:hypothetical protein